MDIHQIIKESVSSEGSYIWGTCHLGPHLDGQYGRHTYAIVLGRKLDDTIIDRIARGPTTEYYQHYNETNDRLSEDVQKLSMKLAEMGISAVIVKPTLHDSEISESYYSTLRYDFSHKMAATQAGLGWIGKTDLFISREFGPRVRLATVLVDRPFKQLSEPVTQSKCGECDICVRACPGNAANGKKWDISVDRDEFYNAFTCRRLAGEIGIEASICGICVSVCPVGRK